MIRRRRDTPTGLGGVGGSKTQQIRDGADIAVDADAIYWASATDIMKVAK